MGDKLSLKSMPKEVGYKVYPKSENLYLMVVIVIFVIAVDNCKDILKEFSFVVKHDDNIQ